MIQLRLWIGAIACTVLGYAPQTAFKNATRGVAASVPDQTDQTGIPILTTILRKAGQRDGKSIIDFTLSAPCTSTITTIAGTKTVDWSNVQDWAARDEHGRTFIDLNDGRETSVVSLPTKPQPEPIGNAFARVEGGFLVLAETCSKKP